MDAIRGLWAYRGFILGSVKREFQSRYRNSLLGAAWTVLNPLAMIFVYTVIFSQVMRAKLPGVVSTYGYSIYLCAGILTWGMFSEITSRGVSTFIDNANLLKKLSFPRLCLPVIVVISALVNFAIVFSLFTAFLIVTDDFPGLIYFAIFPVLLIQVLFAVGLGITLGVLNVFFRDVGHLFAIALQFWFWLTPVVYPVSAIPARARPFLEINPMTHLIRAYQDILVNGTFPDVRGVAIVGAISIVMCLIGFTLFRRHGGDMVDEL